MSEEKQFPQHENLKNTTEIRGSPTVGVVSPLHSAARLKGYSKFENITEQG
ncbi:MAG: hypothetical protein KC587_01290 [Nitrospira sp.]|nr:hypothetical protein [Nitrospira sp.]